MIDLYLIRHGKPDFPEGRSCCLGQSDFPLFDTGRLQACLLGAELRDRFSKEMPDVCSMAIYTSPLSRARETAEILASMLGNEESSNFSNCIRTLDKLTERSTGDWDGLTFEEIRQTWPKLYEKRGKDLSTPIPGEETREHALLRFQTAMENIVQETVLSSAKDKRPASVIRSIGVVAHTDVISLYLKWLSGSEESERNYRLSYGGYAILKLDPESGLLTWDGSVHVPAPLMTDELCRSLRQAIRLPENVCQHCEQVAANVLRIAGELEAADPVRRYNHALLYQAALLHDLLRLHKHHARLGGEVLTQLGYPQLAALVGSHQNYSGTELDEAALLFLADKEIKETTRVSIDTRFAASRGKCLTDQAKENHQRIYETALSLKEQINSICRKEVIL